MIASHTEVASTPTSHTPWRCVEKKIPVIRRSSVGDSETRVAILGGVSGSPTAYGYVTVTPIASRFSCGWTAQTARMTLCYG